MKANITVNTEDMEKEDLRELIQLVREWELRSPATRVVGVFFSTEPQISTEEARQLFEGVFPKFQHVLAVPTEQPDLVRLGTRMVVVKGVPVGSLGDLTMSIGEASEEQIKQIQEAQTITLVKIQEG